MCDGFRAVQGARVSSGLNRLSHMEVATALPSVAFLPAPDSSSQRLSSAPLRRGVHLECVEDTCLHDFVEDAVGWNRHFRLRRAAPWLAPKSVRASKSDPGIGY